LHTGDLTHLLCNRSAVKQTSPLKIGQPGALFPR
jgi:hypothetical protein